MPGVRLFPPWGDQRSAPAIAALRLATASAGPSGAFQTALETAIKSAPARTIGPQLPASMPPIATHATVVADDQSSIREISARVDAIFVAVGKNAPKAT